MKCRPITASFSRRRNLIAIGAALLILVPGLSYAAPDQPRLNRPSLSLKTAPRQEAQEDQSRAACPVKASSFSDRAFLSAELARQNTAMDMAQEVLSQRSKLSPQIELWAQRLLASSQSTVSRIDPLLLAEGGVDRKAYVEAREALLPQKTQKQSVASRFLMFLFPYCEQTMTSAIPALLKASQNDVAELANDLLSAQAKLSLELRDWLHTHHYRKSI